MKRKTGIMAIIAAVVLICSCTVYDESTRLTFTFPGNHSRALSTVTGGTLKVVNSGTGQEKVLNGISGQTVSVEVEADQTYNIFATIYGTKEIDEVCYMGAKYGVTAESGKNTAVVLNLYEESDPSVYENYVLKGLFYYADAAEGEGVYAYMNEPVNTRYFEGSWAESEESTGSYSCWLNPGYFSVTALPANSVGLEVPVEVTYLKTGQKFTTGVRVYAKVSQLADFNLNKPQDSINKIPYYTGKDEVTVSPVLKCNPVKVWHMAYGESGNEIYSNNEMPVSEDFFNYSWIHSGQEPVSGATYEVSDVENTKIPEEIQLKVSVNSESAGDLSSIIRTSEDAVATLKYLAVSWKIQLLLDGVPVTDTEKLIPGKTYDIGVTNELGSSAPEGLTYSFTFSESPVTNRFVIEGSHLTVPYEHYENSFVLAAYVPADVTASKEITKVYVNTDQSLAQMSWSDLQTDLASAASGTTVEYILREDVTTTSSDTAAEVPQGVTLLVKSVEGENHTIYCGNDDGYLFKISGTVNFTNVTVDTSSSACAVMLNSAGASGSPKIITDENFELSGEGKVKVVCEDYEEYLNKTLVSGTVNYFTCNDGGYEINDSGKLVEKIYTYSSWDEMKADVETLFDTCSKVNCVLTTDSYASITIFIAIGKTLKITGNNSSPVKVNVTSDKVMLQNSGTLTVEGIEFIGVASSTGNIVQAYGTTKISYCKFNNTNDESAVLVDYDGSNSFTVENTEFENCSASNNPGAIKIQKGDVNSISNCNFVSCTNKNTSNAVFGGAIHSVKSIYVTACSFSGNSDTGKATANDIYMEAGNSIWLYGKNCINSVLLNVSGESYASIDVKTGFSNCDSNNNSFKITIALNSNNYNDLYNRAVLNLPDGEQQEMLNYFELDDYSYQFNTEGKVVSIF